MAGYDSICGPGEVGTKGWWETIRKNQTPSQNVGAVLLTHPLVKYVISSDLCGRPFMSVIDAAAL